MRLKNNEKLTDEWKERMVDVDENIKERLNAKDIDISEGTIKEPYWERLTLNENDEELIQKYRHQVKTTG